MGLSNNAQKVKDWFVGAHASRNIGGDKFGHRDYANLLYHQVKAGGGFLGSVNTLREATLEWLRHEESTGTSPWLNSSNYEGKGTLIDDLADGDRAFEMRMVYEPHEGFEAEGLGHHTQGQFGYLDFMHARSHGKNDKEILNWMRDNRDKVTPNDPNLYKHIWDAAGGPSDIPDKIDGTLTIGGDAEDDTTGTSDTTGQTGPVKDDEGKDVGGELYGPLDYIEQLRTIWKETGNSSEMHRHREKIMDWIDKEARPGIDIDDKNRRGAHNPDGLYEQLYWNRRTGGGEGQATLRDSKGSRIFDENQLKIGTWAPQGDLGDQDKLVFTEADMLFAIAGGHDKFEIYKKLRSEPTWYQNNEKANEIYNEIRSGLILRSPVYDLDKEGGDWRGHLQNPLYQEVGEYINSSKETRAEFGGGKRRDWVTHDDYRKLTYFISTHMPEGKKITDFRTDKDLQDVIGNWENDPNRFEPGTYWEQYGAAGPPELDQGTFDKGEGDLSWIQKMVAATGFKSRDESDWQEAMEEVENKFLDELYGTGGQWKDAPDEWGLDIMRLDADGDELEFRSGDGAGNEDWYETLTKGSIDWAFYQDSKIYQKAKEALGLEGTFSAASLGVQGIREANVWVHGQSTMGFDYDSDWVQWTPPTDWKKEYTPKELTITGYQPENLKGTATPKSITAPTINIPDVTIERPANLKTKIGKIVGE